MGVVGGVAVIILAVVMYAVPLSACLSMAVAGPYCTQPQSFLQWDTPQAVYVCMLFPLWVSVQRACRGYTVPFVCAHDVIASQMPRQSHEHQQISSAVNVHSATLSPFIHKVPNPRCSRPWLQLPLLLLRAGAVHVTVIERWALYVPGLNVAGIWSLQL